MSGAITEAILTISVILVAATTAAVMMQSIYDLDKTNYALLDTTKQSISTSLKIIFATNSSTDSIKLWVKNVGVKEVESSVIGKITLFLGPRGNIRYIPFNASEPPSWSCIIVNDLDSDYYIDSGETLEITVRWGEVIAKGDWYLQLITPYGTSNNYAFSVGG